jgi:hypothetical protein
MTVATRRSSQKPSAPWAEGPEGLASEVPARKKLPHRPMAHGMVSRSIKDQRVGITAAWTVTTSS